jgi:hypothetical protein
MQFGKARAGYVAHCSPASQALARPTSGPSSAMANSPSTAQTIASGKLLHDPISHGALMAQRVCSMINWCPTDKPMAHWGAHGVNPHGTPMAHGALTRPLAGALSTRPRLCIFPAHCRSAFASACPLRLLHHRVRHLNLRIAGHLNSSTSRSPLGRQPGHSRLE